MKKRKRKKFCKGQTYHEDRFYFCIHVILQDIPVDEVQKRNIHGFGQGGQVNIKFSKLNEQLTCGWFFDIESPGHAIDLIIDDSNSGWSSQHVQELQSAIDQKRYKEQYEFFTGINLFTGLTEEGIKPSLIII